MSSTLLAFVSAALLAAAALPSLAEDAPAAAPAPSGDRPENGMRMNAVESRYGAPTTRYPAVGVPAITRWDYPGFVVYFENDLVLHAVLTGAG
ncbi:MAG TPA: hypothetical protein VMU00_07480 [Steroidobacteraceae bacterium]|nr:hypothetical protein [Steroidobacteraceae bacterium]